MWLVMVVDACGILSCDLFCHLKWVCLNGFCLCFLGVCVVFYLWFWGLYAEFYLCCWTEGVGLFSLFYLWVILNETCFRCSNFVLFDHYS